VCIDICILELSETNALVMFQGDIGGPLAIWRGFAATQIGVVSFSSGSTCAVGQPVAFTRITSFLTWIRDHTGVGI
jgi:secreted trypsin-like serine protease